MPHTVVVSDTNDALLDASNMLLRGVDKLADRYLLFARTRVESDKSLKRHWDYAVGADPCKIPDLVVGFWFDEKRRPGRTDPDYERLRAAINDAVSSSPFYRLCLDPNLVTIQRICSSFRMEVIIRAIRCTSVPLPEPPKLDETHNDRRVLRSLRIAPETRKRSRG
jgi:hypothetical protein